MGRHRTRNLITTENKNHDQPAKEETELCWNSVWSEEMKLKNAQSWMKAEEEALQRVPELKDNDITEEDIKEYVLKTQNWKASGFHHIQNYWYKPFQGTHCSSQTS
jgi:hypothetical protein